MAKGKQPNPNISVRGIGELDPGTNLTGEGRLAPVPTESNKKLRANNQVATNMAFSLEIMRLSEQSEHATDVGELRGAFMTYLSLCEAYNIQPDNLAAYGAIGIDLTTARVWASGKAGREKQELVRFVNKIVGIVRATGMATGTVSPAIGMFMQKNFDGLSDQPTQVAEDTDLLGEKPSAEDIIDRYSDLPDED